MIKSYLFPLTKQESKFVSAIGWAFIKENRSRLVEIDLDISSIDFSFDAARFVHEDFVYKCYNTYCETVNGNTNRIILGVVIDSEKETVDVSDLIPEDEDVGEAYLKLLNERNKLQEEKEELESKVSTGQAKLTAKIAEYGVVTTSGEKPSFDNLVEDVVELATTRYNKGYNSGVAAADGRSNPSSTNYKAGYNAGVAAADGRALPGTVNYQSGYNAGHSAGYSQGVTDADNRANSASPNWQNGYYTGYNQGVTDADNRANGNSVNYLSGWNGGVAAADNGLMAAFTSHGYYNGRHCMAIYIGKSGYIGQGSGYNGVYGASVGGARFEVLCFDTTRYSFASFPYSPDWYWIF